MFKLVKLNCVNIYYSHQGEKNNFYFTNVCIHNVRLRLKSIKPTIKVASSLKIQMRQKTEQRHFLPFHLLLSGFCTLPITYASSSHKTADVTSPQMSFQNKTEEKTSFLSNPDEKNLRHNTQLCTSISFYLLYSLCSLIIIFYLS
jgi:hypothetical protein